MSVYWWWNMSFRLFFFFLRCITWMNIIIKRCCVMMTLLHRSVSQQANRNFVLKMRHFIIFTGKALPAWSVVISEYRGNDGKLATLTFCLRNTGPDRLWRIKRANLPSAIPIKGGFLLCFVMKWSPIRRLVFGQQPYHFNTKYSWKLPPVIRKLSRIDLLIL